jgi:hypothetical protein
VRQRYVLTSPLQLFIIISFLPVVGNLVKPNCCMYQSFCERAFGAVVCSEEPGMFLRAHEGLLEAWSVLLRITGIPGIPTPALALTLERGCVNAVCMWSGLGFLSF